VSAGDRPRSLSDVSVPRRPAGVPYEEGEDHDALALLQSNGYGDSTPELLAALDGGFEMFRAAAARVLGARGAPEAAEALERLAGDPDAAETARVQAAYALARMGRAGGREVLEQELRGNPEAGPAPLQAAGALARLGDAQGFDVVRSALESPNRVTAMIATKQLSAFAGLEGIDVGAALERASQRPEAPIAGEARAQLEALGRAS
jgi:HEAT repeat protein